METNSNNNDGVQQVNLRYNRNGRILGGMVIISAGALLLARAAGADLPPWLFSWPVVLIAIGFFILAKNAFRRPGGLILIAIGSFFLAGRLIPNLSIGSYFWPLILIFSGIVYMFSRSKHQRHCSPEYQRAYWRSRYSRKAEGFTSGESTAESTEIATDPDAIIEVTTIFGGTKKKIISKNFKGGEIVTVFGGAEIDLSQAEISGPVVLEMTQLFGGTKLIIPAHWHLQSEMVTILGGTEDKRNPSSFSSDPSKTLILHGTVALGGIDIRSYH
jgi:predicted membrane protein